MNRSRPRIVVRARDPRLRALIEERLAGLGDVSAATDGEDPGSSAEVLVDAADEAPGVTPRETEVLRLMADGLANKEIAARLGITSHTAKFHVESLLRKLEAVNRAEAVREGIRLGLIGV